MLAAVAGRLTRSWWARRSPESKALFWAALRRRRQHILAVAAGLAVGGGAYYWSHLEEAPLTGRRRFVMFSRRDLVDLIAEEKEGIFEMLCKGQQPLPTSDPSYQHILSLVSVILARNWSEAFEGFQWRLYVVDIAEVNAICLPSGELIVFKGLLDACHNDSELAFILSHEVAHAVLGHGAEGLSHRGVLEFLALLGVGVLWLVVPNDLAAYFLHRFSHSTAEVLFDLPYSRMLEAEADRVGLQFATAACFDPGQAVEVWTHLPALGGGQAAQLLSTHPSHEARLEELSAMLPALYATWQLADCEAQMKEEVDNFYDTVKNTLNKVAKWW